VCTVTLEHEISNSRKVVTVNQLHLLLQVNTRKEGGWTEGGVASRISRMMDEKAQVQAEGVDDNWRSLKPSISVLILAVPHSRKEQWAFRMQRSGMLMSFSTPDGVMFQVMSSLPLLYRTRYAHCRIHAPLKFCVLFVCFHSAPMSSPDQPLISTKDPQNFDLLARRILGRPISQDPSQSLINIPRSRGARIPVIIRLHLVIWERLSIILIRNNCQLLLVVKGNECARFRWLQ
jgi:hypothetical protein